MKGGAAAAECWFRFGRQFQDVELYLVGRWGLLLQDRMFEDDLTKL
jgi:hypothetical protein